MTKVHDHSIAAFITIYKWQRLGIEISVMNINFNIIKCRR